MIHIFVGTKAQFIKMAPIMMELDKRQVAYNFIDAGQHGSLTGDLINQFKLRRPDVFLRAEKDTIKSITQALHWTIISLKKILFSRQIVFKQVFQAQKGICLIHGDTLTTLISLLYAKRCKLQLGHVEAGLRSYRLFDPFPEEFIRLIAMRYSDILFAPSDWAYQNLQQMGYGDKSIHIGGNTVIDTIRYASQFINGGNRPQSPYVVATTHRVETLYSRSRMRFFIETLMEIAKDRQVLFVLHHPTRVQLEHFGFYQQLDNHSAIHLMPLQPYLQFVDLLGGAEFIVTDGGSIQEESYILHKPCLIMRAITERMDGIGENAFVVNFEKEKVTQFLQQLPSRNILNIPLDNQPSKNIVDHILPMA